MKKENLDNLSLFGLSQSLLSRSWIMKFQDLLRETNIMSYDSKVGNINRESKNQAPEIAYERQIQKKIVFYF